MGDPIVDRIEREHGLEEATEALAALPAADLSSLLLAATRRRVARLRPVDVLRRYRDDRLARPSVVDARALAGLESRAFELLPSAFEVLALSPLAPPGTVAIGGLSPDLAVGTVRCGEVLSDVTNVLALEAAERRRSLPADIVRLAACSRVVRPQRYDDPTLVPHFLLLGLVTAGRAQADRSFERSALAEHVDFYRSLLGGAAHVSVTPLDAGFEPLCSELPNCELDRDRSAGRGYYRGLCFAVANEGGTVADGGVVDWTAQLLGNAKERLLISGVGLERL